MESVLIALLVSATSPTAPTAPAAASGPAPLDVDCFRLMVELASDEDPRIRSMGTVGAQYFLGRIDAAVPGYDVEQALEGATGDRDGLLRQCGDVLRAGGRDFRAIGDSLAATQRTQI